METKLSVKNLRISFRTSNGKVQAVRDINFDLAKGETLAIVGESGSGKSVFCKNFMGLLDNNGWVDSGTIIYKGMDLAKFKGEKDWTKIRGGKIATVFQDPMTALNPTIPIGKQIAEAILIHEPKLSKEDVYNRVIELMELVGIKQPHERYKLYPYNFSGGMRQRVMIAMALAAEPRLIIADEPTGNLDSKHGAEVMDLLKQLHAEGTTIVMVTHSQHDANYADRIVRLFDGEVVNEVEL